MKRTLRDEQPARPADRGTGRVRTVYDAVYAEVLRAARRCVGVGCQADYIPTWRFRDCVDSAVVDAINTALRERSMHNSLAGCSPKEVSRPASMPVIRPTREPIELALEAWIDSERERIYED